MKKHSLLVVDDQKSACEGLRQLIDDTLFEVDTANTLQSATMLWDEKTHDIVLTDLRMPAGQEGLELLSHVKTRRPESTVIIMTASGDVSSAVQAMKLGAFDYLTKPFGEEELTFRLECATKNLDLINTNRFLSQEISDEHVLIGNSSVMNELKRTIFLIASSDSRVLITGRHGTGKELIAWAIQKASRRATKPFVRVNCAAIAETLIEAELFGSEKGSYSGSNERKIGKFEQADGGTLFLDEIGDMSLSAQAKVLRVLESGEITRVGSSSTFKVDTRVIAATNKDLPVEIRHQRFREDLYYRLNTVMVVSPPLADRIEDIPLLVEHFLARMGRPSLKECFTGEAVDYLQKLSWPGNVRELKNVVERVVLFNQDRNIGLEAIRACVQRNEPVSAGKPGAGAVTLREARDVFEKDFISSVLSRSKNITEAAESLGIQRPYLYQKLKDLGIEMPIKELNP
jgi:two-component system nitrogen regulation response regulator NtrX